MQVLSHLQELVGFSCLDVAVFLGGQLKCGEDQIIAPSLLEKEGLGLIPSGFWFKS